MGVKHTIPPWWGVLGIGTMALTLRLWQLGGLRTLVFDEVYYVPFALDYLQGTPSFDAHPPLAKYLIALGLWLGQWPATWLGWPTVEVEGTLVSPLAFRWLNAVVGATIPLLLAALAWELGAMHHGCEGDRLSTTVEDPPKSPLERGTLNRAVTPLPKGSRGDPPVTLRQHRFALLTGLLMTLEGLTLVESRLALINIYGLALGLLGQWAWIRAGRSPHSPCWRWLAGIALGAASSVKWNWAGFWLGLVLWKCATNLNIKHLLQTRYPVGAQHAVPLLGQLTNWVVIPLVIYVLLWFPHLALTGESLGEVHRQLWSTHQVIGETVSHAYCSPWYSWPLMLRPVAYFFERGEGTATTIHAMGNPVLWWLSTAAVLALTLGWLGRRISPNTESIQISRRGTACCAPATRPVVAFILLNYLANWLPWVLVSRCTFLYHAMGIVVFSTLGLAWLMAQWLENRRDRPLALLLLGAIALSFWFWLPLYLGLPLSPASLQQRWLLPGWI
ncbi:MAG: phospholipid carrier-dependent glycosyltransferase [Nodosilinea sp.]